LVEALADREAQAPEGQRIRQVRVADRAEVDGVETAELVQPVLRHHAAGLAVEIAAPGEVHHLQLEVARAGLERAQDLEARGDDLLADSVSGDGGDAVAAHEGSWRG
jgi:putative intracellular protease/amidase